MTTLKPASGHMLQQFKQWSEICFL